jgi:hypothetical protein
MLRVLGVATLVLLAVCLALSASIALADETATPAATMSDDRTIEAVDPDRRMVDNSLASLEDVGAVGFGIAPDA